MQKCDAHPQIGVGVSSRLRFGTLRAASHQQSQVDIDGTAAPAGRAIDPSDPAVPGSVRILVDRTREQAALRDELAAAFGGQGRLVLVGAKRGSARRRWPTI
jgi:hypothetical protein